MCALSLISSKRRSPSVTIDHSQIKGDEDCVSLLLRYIWFTSSFIWLELKLELRQTTWTVNHDLSHVYSHRWPHVSGCAHGWTTHLHFTWRCTTWNRCFLFTLCVVKVTESCGLMLVSFQTVSKPIWLSAKSVWSIPVDGAVIYWWATFIGKFSGCRSSSHLVFPWFLAVLLQWRPSTRAENVFRNAACWYTADF